MKSSQHCLLPLFSYHSYYTTSILVVCVRPITNEKCIRGVIFRSKSSSDYMRSMVVPRTSRTDALLFSSLSIAYQWFNTDVRRICYYNMHYIIEAFFPPLVHFISLDIHTLVEWEGLRSSGSQSLGKEIIKFGQEKTVLAEVFFSPHGS